MSIRDFKTIPSDVDEVNKLQNNIVQYVQPITSSQIIDGLVLKSISLNASITNKISHKLGRELIGWIIIRQRGDSRIWDDQDNNPGKRNTLNLKCSSNVIVDIWVF